MFSMRSSVAALCGAVSLLLASSESVLALSSSGPQAYDKERAFVTGKVLSYAWLLSDGDVKGSEEGRELALKIYGAKVGYRDYGYIGHGDVFSPSRNSNAWGANYDAVLSMGLRSKRDALGSVYGADFTLIVPAGSGGGSVVYGSPGVGSRVFADTVLGNFSMGYQEGVEALMKVDVLGNMSGESGSAWGRYLRNFLRYANGVPFHMYPGLYSENLFRSRGSSDRVSGFSAKFRDVLNSMPMRLSYVSEKMGGVTVGFSYSLSGYRDDTFRGGDFTVDQGVTSVKYVSSSQELVHEKKMLTVTRPRFDFGPVYKNILSGAIRYDIGSEDGATLGVSLAGEYAKPKRRSDLVPGRDDGKKEEGVFIEYNNLEAVSAGIESGYRGLRFAVGGGYLGKSGRPKVYVTDKIRGKIPYVKDVPSYYLASSLSYTKGAFSASVTYFESILAHNPPAVDFGHQVDFLKSTFDGENVLRDIVVGFAYSLYKKGTTSLDTFLNCHMFFTRHSINVHNLVDGRVFERGKTYKNTHDGAIAVFGLKFGF
ncbi:hypothetical protein [Candidatus Anaplasma sp. TIGMIC]|uniref:hypothetical protein n=1 Tax=Candidatus Anaplasma sp. TIGMIC TaxID=3020713 RepID=UPI0023307F0C|nr:hypothetical protein [Candidatus Anaplasma sp. TIGMIC]MDB1134973.1 hypothetical protein [Candidatus Anaplasma sp. TIGMIC]